MPSDAPAKPPPGNSTTPREFTATSASTEGHSAVWDGGVGPRVHGLPVTIVFGAGATRVTQFRAACSVCRGCEFHVDAGAHARFWRDEADVDISRPPCRAPRRPPSLSPARVIEGIDDTLRTASFV